MIAEEHGLGRLPSEPDERDDNYSGITLLRATPERSDPARPYKKWYSEAWVGDQGRTNMCTVYSANHLLATGPFTHRPYWSDKPIVPLQETYKAAQCRDPWGCRASDDGTTMRAIAEELRARGVIENYYWFRRMDDLLDYLHTRGPLWIGVDWTEGMARPGPKGLITYTGRSLGGHATQLDEIHKGREEVGGLNSWGSEWGDRGRFRISFRDIERLLANRGEFLAVTEKRKP